MLRTQDIHIVYEVHSVSYLSPFAHDSVFTRIASRAPFVIFVYFCIFWQSLEMVLNRSLFPRSLFSFFFWTAHDSIAHIAQLEYPPRTIRYWQLRVPSEFLIVRRLASSNERLSRLTYRYFSIFQSKSSTFSFHVRTLTYHFTRNDDGNSIRTLMYFPTFDPAP